MIEKLKQKLDFPIVECKFVNRDNMLFLDIELDCPKLSEIEKKSKIISEILDDIDQSSDKYFLNIYSSSVEKVIELENLKNHIGNYIEINLISPKFNNYRFKGDLIEVNPMSVKLFINMKGNFRKIEFEKSNIIKFKQSLKK